MRAKRFLVAGAAAQVTAGAGTVCPKLSKTLDDEPLITAGRC